jgi:hypothetical protein
MKIALKSTLALLGVLVALPASASSWHFMILGTDDTRYYFDADTLTRGKDKTITLWIKSVQTRKVDSRGSWATALRWKIDCANLTYQGLASSSYDQNGNYLSSNADKTAVVMAAPDSLGEGIIQMACEPNFPNDTSKTRYFKLFNNDVYKTTQSYAETFLSSKKDPAPK